MSHSASDEQPLDPDRPIIDPHLHHWEILASPGAPQVPQRFLLPEAVATVAASGHNITHTVFVECHAMYRAEGPPELRPIGETEFANGIAAMNASGGYGSCRFAHRIVGTADLMLGAAVAPVLEAHQAAAGERFRGIRYHVAYSEADMFGSACNPDLRGVMRLPQLHDGVRVLAEKDLSLDIWCVHTQLDELTALADAVPTVTLILDHVGTPEYLGAWAGREAEAFAGWAAAITELARRPNVHMKLGGMGMDLSAKVGSRLGSVASSALAERWRPCIEHCIEQFTPRRCMFESNFPPDRAAGSYGAIWNAFKIITRSYSEAEKDALFRATAAAVYRIDAPNSLSATHLASPAGN